MIASSIQETKNIELRVAREKSQVLHQQLEQAQNRADEVGRFAEIKVDNMKGELDILREQAQETLTDLERAALTQQEAHAAALEHAERKSIVQREAHAAALEQAEQMSIAQQEAHSAALEEKDAAWQEKHSALAAKHEKRVSELIEEKDAAWEEKEYYLGGAYKP